MIEVMIPFNGSLMVLMESTHDFLGRQCLGDDTVRVVNKEYEEKTAGADIGE